jgi:hypothetical protein
MNSKRAALAVLAAWIVDGVYGFIVYGNLMKDEFAKYPGIFRPMDGGQMTFMPYLFLGTLIAIAVATYMYTKGYEGGSGLAEGARFGLAIGILVGGYGSIIGYATMNVGRRFTGAMFLAGLIEWMIAGIVIGLVYKPLPGAKTTRA